MLRALIFDFDGVIVDSEGIILKLTQQMAAQEGWTVSEEDYFRHFLALDDRGIVEYLYRAHGCAVDPKRREELVAWKEKTYWEIIQNGLPAMPGAEKFIERATSRYPLAIASGSLRREIEHLLVKLGLREKFAVLATADDCERSKPDPEVYLKALERLRGLETFRERPLRAAECLAIEDAPGGIEAAHRAGMKCLALVHSRPKEELGHADWVFHEFSEVNLDEIAASFN